SPASPDSSASVTRCQGTRSLCVNYDPSRHCCQSTSQALSLRVPGGGLRAEDRGSSGCPILLADAEPKERDGSRPCALERFQVDPGESRGREKANAVTEQNRQDIHQDLVHEPSSQALTGHVSTDDFEVLAARGMQRGGDGFPDITGEERDPRVRRLRRFVGE